MTSGRRPGRGESIVEVQRKAEATETLRKEKAEQELGGGLLQKAADQQTWIREDEVGSREATV